MAMPALGMYSGSAIRTSSSRSTSEDMNAKRMSLTVFPGRGGMAIEVGRNIDGDYVTILHIVPEGEDLATSLAHIITMESVR